MPKPMSVSKILKSSKKINDYLISFEYSKNCQVEEKSEEQCVLAVSLGKPEYEGQKLKAILRSFPNFFHSPQKHLIFLADSLQGYNLVTDSLKKKYTQGILEENYEGLIPKSIHEADRRGNEWITRYKECLENFQVIKWQNFLKNPGFNKSKYLIESLYTNDSAFKAEVDFSVKHFLKHKKGITQEKFPGYYEVFMKLGLLYVLEECAVAHLWLTQKICTLVAYPGEINQAISYIWQEFKEEDKAWITPIHIKISPLSDIQINKENQCQNAVDEIKTISKVDQSILRITETILKTNIHFDTKIKILDMLLNSVPKFDEDKENQVESLTVMRPAL